MIDIISLLYLLIPAGFANMFASLSAKIFPNSNYPMDFNIKIFNQRLFGSHKTIRGLIFGVIGGIIGSLIQYQLINFHYFKNITLIDYSIHGWILIGFLFGIGTILGDAIESSIKRQIGIEPGKSFIPFDQIDWIIGTAIFILPIYKLKIIDLMALIVTYFFIHIIIRYLGYKLKLNKGIL